MKSFYDDVTNSLAEGLKSNIKTASVHTECSPELVIAMEQLNEAADLLDRAGRVIEAKKLAEIMLKLADKMEG
jgi:hypothetical protein